MLEDKLFSFGFLHVLWFSVFRTLYLLRFCKLAVAMEPADLLRPLLRGWTLPLLMFTLGYTLIYLPYVEKQVRIDSRCLLQL